MAAPARALLTYAPRRSSAALAAGRPWAPLIPTASSALRSNTRCLSCTRARRRQHLWWAGSVLDRVSPYLQEVPRDWLAAIGMGADADDGLGFTHLAGGVAHSLLAYRTDPRKRRRAHAAPKEDGEEGGKKREIQEVNVILDSGEEAPEMNDGGFAKIVAIGRNTQGQLGLGFTSQESSWGMVSAGFAGRSIAGLQVGNGTSFVVMEQDDGEFVQTTDCVAPAADDQYLLRKAPRSCTPLATTQSDSWASPTSTRRPTTSQPSPARGSRLSSPRRRRSSSRVQAKTRIRARLSR